MSRRTGLRYRLALALHTLAGRLHPDLDFRCATSLSLTLERGRGWDEGDAMSVASRPECRSLHPPMMLGCGEPADRPPPHRFVLEWPPAPTLTCPECGAKPGVHCDCVIEEEG